jgi:glutathione synthase/RimK-type ligase-like ATP-grasp enzyme
MRIGFVTSDEAIDSDREMSNLMSAAAAAGLQAEVVSWERGSAHESLDVLVIRSTWNYVAKLEEFLAWTRLFRNNNRTGNGPILLNSEAVVRWNCHKRYLGELARNGIAAVESDLARSLPEVLACARKHDRAVAKPAVGSGALGCSRFTSADLPLAEAAFNAAAAVWPEVIVQPYLDSVEEAGEISLVVIDGEIVQGLRKSPAAGDWRTPPEWGSTVSDAEATPEHYAIADACTSYVTRRCGSRPLYMRVDLITGSSGRSLISEVELIEPMLYADMYPEVAERLVDSLASIADRRSGLPR